jgi:hypothetical protein
MRNLRIAVCCVALLAGCSSGTSEEEQAAATSPAGAPAESGAGQAVRSFYDHLNAGHHDAALALYIDANRTAMAAPDSGFAEWAAEETKGGTIQEVVVEPVTIPGDTVKVPFTLVYQDGSRAERTVDAYRIVGNWQLGSIEMR